MSSESRNDRSSLSSLGAKRNGKKSGEAQPIPGATSNTAPGGRSRDHTCGTTRLERCVADFEETRTLTGFLAQIPKASMRLSTSAPGIFAGAATTGAAGRPRRFHVLGCRIASSAAL